MESRRFFVSWLHSWDQNHPNCPMISGYCVGRFGLFGVPADPGDRAVLSLWCCWPKPQYGIGPNYKMELNHIKSVSWVYVFFLIHVHVHHTMLLWYNRLILIFVTHWGWCISINSRISGCRTFALSAGCWRSVESRCSKTWYTKTSSIAKWNVCHFMVMMMMMMMMMRMIDDRWSMNHDEPWFCHKYRTSSKRKKSELKLIGLSWMQAFRPWPLMQAPVPSAEFRFFCWRLYVSCRGAQ